MHGMEDGNRHRVMSVLPGVSEIHVYCQARLNFMVSDIGCVPEIQDYSDTN